VFIMLKGTAVLARSARGDTLDVLGPLGVPYHLEDKNFETGVLIAGGLGIAPMPLATRALRAAGKKILTILGGRTSEQIVQDHLENVHISTDDGSRGFHGTVVDLAENLLAGLSPARPKLFACGPTAMLRAVAALAIRKNLPCEVSLEGAMACGIGICQGCPVELVGAEKKYALMCKDGPTFDVRSIRL
jgi:dihydroorotate dehydrogenase electron transfer subunit